MRRFDRRFRITDTTLLSGWLFADLLLGLAVIFLAANTVGYTPRVIPTPVSTAVLVPSPSPSVVVTPVPAQRLELTRHRLVLPVDPNGLLANAQSAINSLEQEIKAQNVLRGRTAGLVIAYGGAPTFSSIGRAQEIASKVLSVLQLLGKQGVVFTSTSYYDPLYTLYSQDTFTVLDIYLFAV